MLSLDLVALIFFGAYVAGFATAVHAVMETRTSQGAIAWSVSLVTFPFVSVPLYWVFGRVKFRGYVRAHRRDLDQIRSLWERGQDGADRLDDLRGNPAHPMLGAECLARFPALTGNRVELLIDGPDTFESIFAGIDQAQHYVLVQFYIVRDDGLGNEMKRRLIRQVEKGVKVRFLYDEVGSVPMSQRYLNDMHVAGVEILPFNTRKGIGNRLQLNFRNHRKVVVVDGHTAWIGGHNVGDEYLGLNPQIGRWRDTHIRIEGPSVLGVQMSFVEDWRWASEHMLADLKWSARPCENGQSTVLVVPSGPADAVDTAALMFRHAINTARFRIWIASPYFVPDEGIIAALQLAGLRGTEVRILIPDKADNPMVTLAAYSYFDDIAETGVTFWRYQAGLMHYKALLIDDTTAAVGTANFDNRSFRLNFEITAFVIDETFAAQVEAMFRRDFGDSRRMEPGESEGKSFSFRFAARVSRLAAPVL